MSAIFAIYSDPANNIPEVTNEFLDFIALFNDEDIKDKVVYDCSRDDSLEVVTEKIAGIKDLRLIYYSGHSGKDGLDFSGEDFTTRHVSEFFKAISEKKALQCVFLNGCENEAIVQLLSEVPIVIGTKSKIEDTVAIQFAKIFFTALLKSENSYKQAFNIAVAALDIPAGEVSRTRSEGSSSRDPQNKELNAYFIKVQDEKFENATFPFIQKRNWTKYIFIFFLLAALILALLFQKQIRRILFKYDCSGMNFKDDDTCNMVVGDYFSNLSSDQAGTLINAIKMDPFLTKRIKANAIKSFSTAVEGSKYTAEDLPGLCNYDFNLFGNISKEKVSFNIFPYDSNSLEASSFHYTIESLQTVNTVVTEFTVDNVNQFVLVEACIRCGIEKSIVGMPAELLRLDHLLASLRGTDGYQIIYTRLANASMQMLDTASAIRAFDKVIESQNNDMVLMADERKIKIFELQGDAINNFKTHNHLIEAYQSRLENPGVYKMKSGFEAYQNAEKKMRFDRAMLILRHKDGALQDQRATGIEDFLYLQKVGFPPGDFSNEIKLLRDTSPLPGDSLLLRGRVFTENKNPVTGATVTFENNMVTTDRSGIFDFGNFETTDVFGKKLSITYPNYEPQVITITPGNLNGIVLVPTVQFLRLQGRVLDENKRPVAGAAVKWNIHTVRTDAKGHFDLGQFEITEITGKILRITADGFLDKSVPISDKSITTIVLSSAELTYTFSIKAYGIEAARYKNVLMGLREHSYEISEATNENYVDPGPATMTRVVYSNDQLLEKATELANLLRKLTDRDIPVEKLQTKATSLSSAKSRARPNAIQFIWNEVVYLR